MHPSVMATYKHWFMLLYRFSAHFFVLVRYGDSIGIYEIATSKLARKTHIDMLNKVQINYYAAGLHSAGSNAVFRYTSLELADRNVLMRAAFSV